RSASSTTASRPGTVRASSAAGWRGFRVSVRSSLLRWSAQLPTRMPLHRAGIWQLGSDWCRNRTRPAARIGLGGITKPGNRYLRWLLVAGATAVIRYAQKHGTAKRPWLARLIERKPTKVAAVALANKIARIAWAIMARGERYRT